MSNDHTTHPTQKSTADFYAVNHSLELGEVSDDVAGLQKWLNAHHLRLTEEERKKLEAEEKAHQLGEMTLLAMEELLAKKLEKDPHNPALHAMARDILHMDASEVGHPERGLGHMVTRNYKHDGIAQLQALEVRAEMNSKPGIDRMVALADAFDGQAEVGADNHGPIVQLMAGCEGKAWCGGYVHYITSHAIPGVYTPDAVLRASSYAEDAEAHGAFHKPRDGYMPRVGDVVSFNHHVGFIVDVKDGHVTYSSGNYADSVSKVQFDIDKPPGGFEGYCDTHALALAKGIDIGTHVATAGPSVPLVKPAPDKVLAHG